MKREFSKPFINVFLIVISVVLLISITGFSASKPEVVVEEWEIPFLNCITGPLASIGEYFVWSAHRAADEINASGGILGKPVKIIDCDTGVSAEKAIEEMAKIVDSALVAMGPVPEACIMAAVPLAVKSGMLCLTSNTMYEYASEYFPWTISWYKPTDKELTAPAAAWAKLNPEMKNVVQFLEKWACWPLMAEAHVVGLESEGVKMLNQVEIPHDAITFSTLVVKALNQKPDGFVLTCTSDKAAQIIVELDKHGWKDKSKILIFVTADDSPLYIIGGAYLNGCYVYNYIDPNCTNPRWVSFRKDYKADQDGLEPAALATLYYDSVYMIKEALQNAGITGDPKKLKEERIKIRDYVRNLKDFEGVQMTWTMKDGVPEEKEIFLFQINDGLKEFITTTK